jgi:hypothetical protein
VRDIAVHYLQELSLLPSLLVVTHVKTEGKSALTLRQICVIIACVNLYLNFMTETEYKRVLKLDYNVLFDLITEHYVYEQGQLKGEEIVNKIKTSQKVLDYIAAIGRTGRMPEPLELLKFVNGLSFLVIAKAETIAVTSVIIAVMLFDQARAQFDPDDQTVSRYFLELIFRCERLKFIKSNTYFSRLYAKLVDAG